MTSRSSTNLVVETEPDPADVRFLSDRLYEFNVAATGISDGELYAIFLRDAEGVVIGGANGWTWGATCYVQHLYLPKEMRSQGYGTKLMDRIEEEARARGCVQIVLESHSFQAPDFYRRRGFVITGTVEGYPRGHRNFTFVKTLADGS